MTYLNQKGKHGNMKWIDDIYNAKIVANGGMVRRGIKSLPFGITPKMVVDDAKRRGHNVVLNGSQIIIFCTPAIELV